MKLQPKRYIVRKLVMATSVKDAIRKEKREPASEVFIDEKWEDERLKQIGFKTK
jgi:hypothetical protein